MDPKLGQVVDHWDDHGGMGNDGSAYWEVTFSPEEAAALEQALPAAEGWQPLPLSDEARRLLYGTDGMEETGEGAFLSMSPLPHPTGRQPPVPPAGGGILVLLR